MKKLFIIILFGLLLSFSLQAQNTGGPDTFGYTYINSLEPNGPVFSWFDTPATNEITGLTDDSYAGPFDIGFNFSFYDSVYDEIYIGSNGLIGFDQISMNSLSHATIPTVDAPNSQIFWCWDDLNPTYTWANSHVYLDSTVINQTNALVISFISYAEYNGSAAPADCISAQVILFDDGNIKMQYDTIGASFDINNCTVGLENEDGTDGLQYRYNTTGAPLQDDLVISFIRPTPQTDDLRALSVIGNAAPTAQISYPYTISVMNRGLNDALNYQVKLMQYVDGANDIELSSTNGTLLTPNASESFIFDYSFPIQGDVQLYGLVEYTADLVPNDNATSLLDVSVQPVGTAVCDIGSDSVLSYQIPFNFYYMNSLTQTMYYPDEIPLGGIITGLDFQVNWVTEMLDKPMNIWIGETNLPDLSGGFIPAGDLTQAFDSTFSFLAGNQTVHLEFNSPYAYNGGNLVLMFERPMDTQIYNSNNRWYCSNSTIANRTIQVSSDNTDYDPYTPPAGNFLAQLPNVRLFFVTSGLGSLEGIVTDGTTPLSGVALEVSGTNYHTLTDANGHYSFPFLPANVYTVTANLHGFYESSQTVTIVEDNSTTADIAMNTLPMCEITGQIIGSDTMNGISGTATLTGYENYTVSTDNNGFFVIQGVYCDNTYQLSLNSLGYSPVNQTVVVNAVDLDLGQIIMQEIAFPVSNVTAEELDTDEALIRWYQPVSTGDGETWIHKDSGTNEDGVGLTSGGTFEVASKFEANEMALYAGYYLNSVRFYLQSNAVLVNVRIYSGDNGNLLLLEEPVTNFTIDAWNEVQLSSSIPIDGTSTIWIGYQVTHGTADRPAGCDGGPHQPGGDMIKTAAVWEELNVLSSTLDVNWNIQGLIGQTPGSMRELEPRFETTDIIIGNRNPCLSIEPNRLPLSSRIVPDRSLIDYTVYSLENGNESSPAAWTQLATVTDTTYTDTAWMGLPTGVYKYAVIANYSNNVHSLPAFSNWIANDMWGSLTVNLSSNVGDIPEGASIDLTALTPDPNGDYLTYHGQINAAGTSVIPHIWYGTYRITATLTGYQGTTVDSFEINGNNSVDLTIIELMIPAHDVIADVNDLSTVVNVHWGIPGEGNAPQWINWDSGSNSNGVGTGAAAEFDIAARWEPEHIDDFGGMFVTQVKFYPRELNCEYTVRVWSGENAETLLGEQLCSNIVSTTQWHTEILTNPVQIDPSQELWVGVHFNTETGWPAGCDAGPAIDGFGNMMHFNGSWQTLLEIAPTLDYNWNIQAWVDWDSNGREPQLLGTHFPSKSSNVYNNSMLTTGFVPAQVRDERVALGYNLYRLHEGQESNPASWVLLDELTSDTLFVDTAWPGLPANNYRYAVKVVYTGELESTASLSNTIGKDERGYLEGFVTNINTNDPINEALIVSDDLQIITDETGYYIIPLYEGLHNLTISANLYLQLELTDIPVLGETVTFFNIEMTPRAIVVGDDFESYDDFALEFGDWTLIDNDGTATNEFANVSFIHEGEAMSFILFNPDSTTPPLPFADAHSGDKYIACFAATPGSNDDWIISPTLQLGEEGGLLNFWARSFTDQYGYEQFNVGVSTSAEGTDDFVMLNGFNPVNVPTIWTYFSYDLSEYVGQTIRVGMQCVSNECFALLVDDLAIDSEGGFVSSESVEQIPIRTSLNSNYPNPFNPTTNISFDLAETAPVTLEIFNIRGQKIKTLTRKIYQPGSYSLIWNGITDTGKNCGSGVYFYKLKAGSYTKSKKMILMK